MFTFAASQCDVPLQFQGNFFSIETGSDTDTLINVKILEHQRFKGECMVRWDDNSTIDAEGRHDSKIVFYDRYAYLTSKPVNICRLGMTQFHCYFRTII